MCSSELASNKEKKKKVQGKSHNTEALLVQVLGCCRSIGSLCHAIHSGAWSGGARNYLSCMLARNYLMHGLMRLVRILAFIASACFSATRCRLGGSRGHIGGLLGAYREPIGSL